MTGEAVGDASHRDASGCGSDWVTTTTALSASVGGAFVALAERVEQERGGLGRFRRGERGDDELVGGVDHPKPAFGGLVVA